MAEDWLEYAELVRAHDAEVEEKPGRDSYIERWRARTRHESWQARRQAFLWYTNETCERCGSRQRSADLQLHHLHYDTLWYENNSDLELLCPSCHRIADEERAEEQAASRGRDISLEQRALNYMEIANRWSGQDGWPVSYTQALERVTELDD